MQLQDKLNFHVISLSKQVGNMHTAHCALIWNIQLIFQGSAKLIIPSVIVYCIYKYHLNQNIFFKLE